MHADGVRDLLHRHGDKGLRPLLDAGALAAHDLLDDAADGCAAALDALDEPERRAEASADVGLRLAVEPLRVLVELRDAQLRHALVIELDAVAAALTAHDDVRRDVAGRLRAVGRARLRVQRADDVDGELHVCGAHALCGRDLLDLARGDPV